MKTKFYIVNAALSVLSILVHIRFFRPNFSGRFRTLKTVYDFVIISPVSHVTGVAVAAS